MTPKSTSGDVPDAATATIAFMGRYIERFSGADPVVDIAVGVHTRVRHFHVPGLVRIYFLC
jgi:hypothetical protein